VRSGSAGTSASAATPTRCSCTPALTGKPKYLTESSTDEGKARQALTRLLAEVDDHRNARTKATLGVALDAWLRVHEVEANTHRAYAGYIRLHIKPALGHVALSKITAQTLEEFCAELRRCRVRCDGQARIEHRTEAEPRLSRSSWYFGTTSAHHRARDWEGR
jgi:hypothetical protein